MECFVRARQGLASTGSTAPVVVSSRTAQLLPHALPGSVKLIGSDHALNSSRK